MSRAPISSHYTMDDPRLYSFARRSGLPAGYFDRPRLTPNLALWLATAALALLLLTAACT